MAKSLASVKPLKIILRNNTKGIGLTLDRYRHIWRVYREAVHFYDAWTRINYSDKAWLQKFDAAQDALFAAIAAAKKAGVK
jgi:hypothetical protein